MEGCCELLFKSRCREFLRLVVVETVVVSVTDADGVYGLVPQRVVDEEDEKLRLWKRDTDVVGGFY